MRRGRRFHASNRILWRNRHLIINGLRNVNRMKAYWEKDFSKVREKEYDVPEPPEMNEEPNWQQTGPEYSSDIAGDGPYNGGDPTISTTNSKFVAVILGMGPEFSSDEAGDGPDGVTGNSSKCDDLPISESKESIKSNNNMRSKGSIYSSNKMRCEESIKGCNEIRFKENINSSKNMRSKEFIPSGARPLGRV